MATLLITLSAVFQAAYEILAPARHGVSIFKRLPETHYLGKHAWKRQYSDLVEGTEIKPGASTFFSWWYYGRDLMIVFQRICLVLAPFATPLRFSFNYPFGPELAILVVVVMWMAYYYVVYFLFRYIIFYKR